MSENTGTPRTAHGIIVQNIGRNRNYFLTLLYCSTNTGQNRNYFVTPTVFLYKTLEGSELICTGNAYGILTISVQMLVESGSSLWRLRNFVQNMGRAEFEHWKVIAMYVRI